jgi:FkbM family methyltransferase
VDLGLALLRARKLAFALGGADTRRALALGVAPAIEHIALISKLKPAVVVDVGANRGQFALAVRRAAPEARVICFEPAGRAYDVLTRVTGPDPLVRTVQAALASEPGALVLQITAEDDSSSALPIGETQARLFGTKVVGQETVMAGPLDQFVPAEELAIPSLLKIDVQGFEREVLLGSRSRLPLFRWVYVEGSFVELYVGQMLAPELVMFMGQAGFDLAGVFNQVFTSELGAVQADFLFETRAAPPLQPV